MDRPVMDRPVQGTVPNYLVPAILTTIFCCLPFGIVSIVFASQVDSKLAAGDYAGAVNSSNKAKTWATVAVVSAAVILVLYLILFFVVGVSVLNFHVSTSTSP